uniref:Plexin_cytopl domain-containing protein n=1 Tax=Steinernema glaseri TaxID=37863 RepID=A0A1I7ZII2_9BILA
MLLSNPSQSTRSPPKILAVGTVGNKHVAFVKPLEYPKMNASNRTLGMSDLTESAVELKELSDLHPLNVLLDSVSWTIYVMARTADNDHSATLYAYSFKEDRKSNIKLQRLFSTSIRPEIAQMHWFSDPYSEQFYYYASNRLNEPIRIKSIHFSEFLQSVTSEFTKGDLKKEIEGDRRAVSVSGGAIFSTRYSSQNINFISSFSHTSKTINCHFHQRRVADAVLVVRDWDYCMLRDGHQANVESCRRNLSDWKEQRQRFGKRAITVLFLLAALVIILAVVLVVIFAVLKRKWEELVSNEEDLKKRQHIDI